MTLLFNIKKELRMDYSQVSNRLRAIKKEIHELRIQPVVDIQNKIQVLKNINLLLREQNKLLLFRQELIDSRQLFSNNDTRTEIHYLKRFREGRLA